MNRTYTENSCLWQQLSAEKRPIFLYGTGNGADKILDVCINKHIPIEGVFASDGFVRNRSFRGMPVQSLAAIEAAHGNDFIVLLAFGTTLPQVWDNIRKIGQHHTLLIPEVPLFGGELFDFAYYTKHLPEIEKAYSLFEDAPSKELFEDMVAFRLTGKPAFLQRTENTLETLQKLFEHKKIRTIVDCGAYTGDSANLFARALHPKEILAAEPDPKTYQKLCQYAEEETACSIMPIHAVITSRDGETEFITAGSRASGTGENRGRRAKRRMKTQTIPCRTIDTLTSGNKTVDLIKLDVEGAEEEALAGASITLRIQNPALAVSLYHRTGDLFALPLMLHDLYPDATFYLRRPPCIPAWDLTLYVVPK